MQGQFIKFKLLVLVQSLASMASHSQSFSDEVQRWTKQSIENWNELDPSDRPQPARTFHQQDQRENYRNLRSVLRKIDRLLPDPLSSVQQKLKRRDEILAAMLPLLTRLLPVEESHVQQMFASGLIKAVLDFVERAKSFDPSLSGAEIFQASRNVWTANSIQFMLGQTVRTTDAIFAYSMLYPYTDNYLDDTSVSIEDKKSFNKRFRKKLAGEEVQPINQHEEKIFQLIFMIESQWSRDQFPRVYGSLLAIQDAQIQSLRQRSASTSLDDVLKISVEKGGTSVLADAFLVAGELSESDAFMMFEYGVGLQFVDDLQDVKNDIREGHRTIFSVPAAAKLPLDEIAMRMMQYNQKVQSDMSRRFPDHRDFLEIMGVGIMTLNFESVASKSDLFSASFSSETERQSALSFKNFLYLMAMVQKNPVPRQTFMSPRARQQYLSSRRSKKAPKGQVMELLSLMSL